MHRAGHEPFSYSFTMFPLLLHILPTSLDHHELRLSRSCSKPSIRSC
ncbi:hypothetical protein KP509_35G007800 [Ceratopteris richardii]|uniref:Uncharacterized protein n=1 Tax=Ceratopteris richardii TaxID=49495 RepID=A0A8T2QEJ4_CERRI|nr:hypothetical protein KP509_35G007800 [Ceratopteris richardii]